MCIRDSTYPGMRSNVEKIAEAGATNGIDPSQWLQNLKFDENGYLTSITAVSYTHLDVYKRQGKGKAFQPVHAFHAGASFRRMSLLWQMCIRDRFRSFPSTRAASGERLFFKAAAVFPNPLPPEVANRMTLFPEKS